MRGQQGHGTALWGHRRSWGHRARRQLTPTYPDCSSSGICRLWGAEAVLTVSPAAAVAALAVGACAEGRSAMSRWARGRQTALLTPRRSPHQSARRGGGAQHGGRGPGHPGCTHICALTHVYSRMHPCAHSRAHAHVMHMLMHMRAHAHIHTHLLSYSHA